MVGSETVGKGKVPLETQRGSWPTLPGCRPQGPGFRESCGHLGGVEDMPGLGGREEGVRGSGLKLAGPRGQAGLKLVG